MRRESGSLHTADGLELFTQRWLPQEPRAAVILSHGYAEHSGRHEHLAEVLAEHGFAVHALDHRGHGRSEGERANVKVFRAYATDLERYSERVRESHPGLPRFLLGHSMGGLIALQFVLEHPEKVDGLVVTAAYIRNAVETPALLAMLARPIATLFPSLPVQALDANALSRDPEVVRAYQADPLVYHGKVKARMGAELLEAGPYVMSRADGIELPVLVLHGGADRIADADGSRELFDTLGSKDKTLEIYEGLYHEIMNEPEHERVLSDITRWLEAHLD